MHRNGLRATGHGLRATPAAGLRDLFRQRVTAGYPWLLLLIGLGSLAAFQAPSVLHIRVTLVHADRTVMPVARHRLLISDNPATAPPREVVTQADGTAEVKLPPGN